MSKKNIAVLFGGVSSEHEVSRRSALSIIKNLNKEKYNLFIIGITKDGKWYLYSGDINKIPDIKKLYNRFRRQIRKISKTK